MLIGLTLVLCLATVPLAGGRLGALADVRFRAPWLALAAIAAQVLVAVADPRLGFLGDVFAVPSSWPVSNVFSAGDVVLVIAALLALHCLCGSRLTLRRRQARTRGR